MATGTISDFTIYQEEFTAGLVEGLDQMVDAFNSAANGAIELNTQSQQGNYAKTRFFDRVSSLISRRDDTATGTVSDTKLSQSEDVNPKVKRRIGPVKDTFDAFDATGMDAGEFSMALGRQVGQEVPKDYLNTALESVKGALTGVSNNNLKVTASTTGGTWDTTTTSSITTTTTAADDTNGKQGLVRMLNAMGDAAGDISLFVMHSSVFYTMMENDLTSSGDSVLGGVVFDGVVGTLGRPVLVTDSSALKISGTTTPSYVSLGLKEGAVNVTESQDRRMVTDVITGNANLEIRLQGEHAFNVGVKGMAYQTGQGSNPNDSTLSSKASWSSVFSSDKNLAGVMLQSL